MTLLMIALATAVLAGPSRAGNGRIDPATGNMTFQVNFRYPPTPAQLADAKIALTRMSAMICDATDGQVRLQTIRLTGGATDEDQANFWYRPESFRTIGSTFPDGSSLRRLGYRVYFSRSAQFQPDVMVHELGHHAFGLGEQYSEQNRSGPCGIGLGFEAGSIDEQNHSIMQQTGRVQCVGGGNANARCLRPTDCPGGTCEAVLMSELSVRSNHDSRQGNTGRRPGAPTSGIAVAGRLPANAPAQTFDGRTFASAASSSTSMQEIRVLDARGVPLDQRLQLYFTPSGTRQYTVTAAIDAGITGGTAGQIDQIEQWVLAFNPDGSLRTQTEAAPALRLTGLASSADLGITLSFGTPNPNASPGAGRDGLRLDGAQNAQTVRTSGGVELCTKSYFYSRNNWDTRTGRWEASDQSLFHRGQSDWETVVANYRFLSAPRALPVAAAPATCATAPAFVDDIVGSDQVLLLLDRSDSMSWATNDDYGEVCGNGRDDDRDGITDERACNEARIDFARAAARAFVALQRDQNIQLGLMEFNHRNRIVRPVANLTAANAGAFAADINSLTPAGTTAIGSALDAARTELLRVRTAGRTRSVLLMTDGVSNTGSDPATAARALRASNVRILSIPTGRAADEKLLGRFASQTGGTAIKAESADDLPGIFAELAFRHRGEALVFPRTDFSIAWQPDRHEDAPEPATREALLDLPVEEGAQALTFFLSGRNSAMATWDVHFELYGPNGEFFDRGSPEVTTDAWFSFIRVRLPAPGTWTLRATPANAELQSSTAVGHVESSDPDFYVDVLPRETTMAQPVVIGAELSWLVGLDGDISIDGQVRRPDGSVVPVRLAREAPDRPWATEFSAWAGRGIYTVALHARVGEARTAAGESIFAGPERLDVQVHPFERFATTSFYLDDGLVPGCGGDCPEPRPEECKNCEEPPVSLGPPIELELRARELACDEPRYAAELVAPRSA